MFTHYDDTKGDEKCWHHTTASPSLAGAAAVWQTVVANDVSNLNDCKVYVDYVFLTVQIIYKNK